MLMMAAALTKPANPMNFIILSILTLLSTPPLWLLVCKTCRYGYRTTRTKVDRRCQNLGSVELLQTPIQTIVVFSSTHGAHCGPPFEDMVQTKPVPGFQGFRVSNSSDRPCTEPTPGARSWPRPLSLAVPRGAASRVREVLG